MTRKKKGRPRKNSLSQELQRKIEAFEGETEEKKIKETKKLMKKEPEICGALQGNGTVCVKAPYVLPSGSINGRCASHGGKVTGQTTEEGRLKSLANLNPKARLVHGMYSEEFKSKFTKEEVEFYNEMINWFFETFPEDTDPVNVSLLSGYATTVIKKMRQESTDFTRESRSQNSFDRLMMSFANELGLNKKYRDSKQNKDNSKSGVAMLFMEDEEKNE